MTRTPRRVAMLGVCFLLGWGTASLFDRNDDLKDQSAPLRNTEPRFPQKLRRDHPDQDLPDVDACRALLASSEASDSRHPLLRRLDREKALRRWLALDPESALKEAEAESSSRFAKDLFLAWIEVNPSRALDSLNQSTGRLKQSIATSFFVALMRKDPRMAAEALRSPAWSERSSSELGWNFYTEVYRQWMLSDPQAAIDSLPRGGSKQDRLDIGSAELAILSEWARSDFQKAWSYLTTEIQDDSDRLPWNATTLLASGLLGMSEEANATLDQTIHGALKDRASYVASAMVGIDLHAALEWAESRPIDDPVRLEILVHAATDLATSDPERALQMLAESGGSENSWENEGILREAFASLAIRDPAAAADRIRQMPDDQKKDAITGYLTNIYSSDPQAAIDQCRSWLDDQKLKSHLMAGWAKSFSWAHGAGIRDPAPVLKQIPALNEAVDQYVLSTWTKADPQAAAGWIKQRLEDGHSVKFGDEGIISDLATQEPQFTAGWIDDLPDSELRTSSANTLVANWAAFDPVAAQAWIDSLPQGELRHSAEAGLSRTKGR